MSLATGKFPRIPGGGDAVGIQKSSALELPERHGNTFLCQFLLSPRPEGRIEFLKQGGAGLRGFLKLATLGAAAEREIVGLPFEKGD